MILLIFFAPSAVLAEVCGKIRPGWTPGNDATAVSELTALLSTPVSLVLLVLSAIALRFRHQWGTLIVVVLWTIWVSLVAFYGADDPIRQSALQEGCIGSPTLFIAVVAAICVGMILYTAPPLGRDKPPET